MAEGDSGPTCMYLPIQVVQASPGFAADIGAYILLTAVTSFTDTGINKPYCNRSDTTTQLTLRSDTTAPNLERWLPQMYRRGSSTCPRT